MSRSVRTNQGSEAFDYLTPEELLEQFRAGSDAAFEALFAQIGGRLFGFLRRYLGDEHLAEDVYQNVLVKVALHAGDYDGRSRLQTWIYQIARHAAVDALRAAKRRHEVAAGTGADGDLEEGGLLPALAGIVSRDLPPLEQLTVEELGRRIGMAVEGLPLEQREVFLLREQADLTFEDIGQMLGCGKETAKSRMRYAMRNLQSALGAEARLFGLLAGL